MLQRLASKAVHHHHKTSIAPAVIESLFTTTAYRMAHPYSIPLTTIHTEKSHIPVTIPTHLFPPIEQNEHHPPLHPLQARSHPLLTHPPFRSWLNTLLHSLSLQRASQNHPFHADPYELKSIKVNHINYFGSGENTRIGFVSMDAEIKNSSGEALPGVIFLRGGAVGILLIVEEEGENEGEQWTILTSQPRIPVGALRFLEIPAGMIDGEGKVTGKAAEEIREELGITIDADKLIDLCALTAQLSTQHKNQVDAATGLSEENLEQGMYPSAGGSDEFIKLYAYIHKVGRGGLQALEGRIGGNRDEGERIILRIIRLQDLWTVAGRDAKALGAWALWSGLSLAGLL